MSCKYCDGDLKKVRDEDGNVIYLQCRDCGKKFKLPAKKPILKKEEEEQPLPPPVVEQEPIKPVLAPVVEEDEVEMPAPAPVVEEDNEEVVSPVLEEPAPAPVVKEPEPVAVSATELAEIAENLAEINTSLKALVAMLNRRLVIVDIEK